jgi:hypothetical protein
VPDHDEAVASLQAVDPVGIEAVSCALSHDSQDDLASDVKVGGQ